MKLGDIVVRNSYNRDIEFKIVDIKNYDGKKFFILKGKSIRIIADALEDDLEVVNGEPEDKLFQEVKDKIKQISINNKKNYRSIRNDINNGKNFYKKYDKKILKKNLILVGAENYYM